MKIRTIVLIVVFVLIGLFALLNWSAIMAPTTLSMIVADIEAPLGLIMLGLMVLLTILFLTFIVIMQAGIMADRRRILQELEAQRTLANEAEASRFSDLRSYLQTAFSNTDAAIKESSNVLSAYIGELEDRLERKIDAK
jgi:hypothetical protein